MKVTARGTNFGEEMRINTNLVAYSPALASILLAGVEGTAVSPLIAVLLDLLLAAPLQLGPPLPLPGVQVRDEAALQSIKFFELETG